MTGWIFVVMLTLAPVMYVAETSPNRFPLKIWVPWMLAVSLSLIWVTDITVSHIQDVLQILTPFIIAPIASKAINSSKRRELLFRSFEHCLLILILALVLHRFFGIEILVRLMSMTAAVVGCVFVARYRESILVALAGWSGCVLVTVMTGSRMATVALLVIWVILPTYRRPLTRLAICGLIAAIAVSLFYSPVFQERFFEGGRGTLADLFAGDYSSAGRFDVWPELVKEIERRPVLGAGIHESAMIVGQVWEDIGKPHNDYLRILLEQGIVGLALFLFGIGSQVFSLWSRGFAASDNSAMIRTAAFLGVFVLLLMAVTDNPIVYGVWFMHPLFVLIGSSYSNKDTSPSWQQQ